MKKSEYAADTELSAATTTELTTAKNLATAALNLQREKERLEDVVIPDLKKQIAEVLEDQLPTLMSQAGLSKFTIENGVEVQSGMKVFASLPNKDKDPEGFSAGLMYLEQHGGGDLPKRVVSIEFNKEDAELASCAVELLNRTFNERQHNYPVTVDVSVHWGTLTSWCKEQLKRGKILDLAKLGGFAKIIASIKRPKGE